MTLRRTQELQRILTRVQDIVNKVSEVQPLLDRAKALTEKIAEPKPEAPPRPHAITHPYQGKPHTVAELAALAGVNRHTMRERLKRLTPEVAVAQGQAKFAPGARRMFELDGKPHTVAELAAKAGISWTAMWQRLQHHSAAEAVSFPKLPKGVQHRRTAPAPEAPPLLASARVRTPTPAPTPAPAPIVPADVKRTVAKAPLGRFEVQHAPPVFGRIGHYEQTGSAVERQYGGKG